MIFWSGRLKALLGASRFQFPYLQAPSATGPGLARRLFWSCRASRWCRLHVRQHFGGIGHIRSLASEDPTGQSRPLTRVILLQDPGGLIR